MLNLKPNFLKINSWVLLNDTRNPNQKSSIKLRQKQFNILNNEYSKFLIYNNASLTTFISLFEHRIHENKFRNLLTLMAIILQTVNSLKVVEIVL